MAPPTLPDHSAVGIIAHGRRIWSFLDRRTRLQLIPFFVAMLAMALLETIGIGLLFGWLQFVTDPARRIPAWLPGSAMLGDIPRDHMLVLTGLALGAFYLGKNALLLALSYLQSLFSYRKHAQFTAELFATYLEGGYAFLSTRNSAEIQRNLVESSINIFANGLLQILNLILEILVILTLLGFLLMLEPQLTLVMGGFMGGLMLSYQRVVSPRLVRWGGILTESSARVLRAIREGVGAIKEIKVLQCEHHFEHLFRSLLLQNARYRTYQSMSLVTPRLYIETLMVLAVLISVILLVRRGEGDILATVGVFGATAVRLMPSANRVLNLYGVVKGGVRSVALLHHDWFQIKSIREPAAPVAETVPRLDSLALDHVSFTYPGRDAPSLDDVSVRLERGNAVALVGRSGAGKTTLADLLLGLLQPDSGQVLVNGAPVHGHLRTLRRRVGFVSQSIFVLDDTLRRNIAFGIDAAKIDDERVARAIRLAELESVVAALPEGLETRLGEGGLRLSGGQRQRVGIARALYHNPDVLVLDEATSALDNETEHKISQALVNIRQEKALLLIAHRLSTVRFCDTIVLMDHGRVIDIGRFDELTERQPEFRRFVELGRLETTET